MTCRRSSGTARSARPEIAEQAAFYGNGYFANNVLAPNFHFKPLVDFYRKRFEHYGHGTQEQAIVGLGGQAFIAKRSQDAVETFRPYFENYPLFQRQLARRLHARHPAERRQPAGGHRQDPDLPGGLRRLPAAALPRWTAWACRWRWRSSRSNCSAPRSCPCCARRWRRGARRSAATRPCTRRLVTAKYGDAEPRQPRPNPNRGDNLSGTSPYQDSDPELAGSLPAGGVIMAERDPARERGLGGAVPRPGHVRARVHRADAWGDLPPRDYGVLYALSTAPTVCGSASCATTCC